MFLMMTAMPYGHPDDALCQAGSRAGVYVDFMKLV